MRNFAFKTRNFVFKTRKIVFKTRKFVFQMRIVCSRTGKVKREGEHDLTYHQYNIERSLRPRARAGKVTIYHILPAHLAIATATEKKGRKKRR